MPKKNSITVTCAQCGKSFLRWPSLVKGRKNQFCSVRCRGLHDSKRTWHECVACGKLFQPRPCQVTTRLQLFCSRACYLSWHTKGTQSLHCDLCGQPIKVKPSRQLACRHHFCSRQHFRQYVSLYRRYTNNGNWRGGREPYRGPNWDTQRQLALERDGFKCRSCSSEQHLYVHHIIPFRFFGLANYKKANQLENLISLCVPCHGKAERKVALGPYFHSPNSPVQMPLKQQDSTNQPIYSLEGR